MTQIDALVIRLFLAPPPRRGLMGLALILGAAIAACEVRTMGMGLHRADGRMAGIADPLLLRAGLLAEAALALV